MEKKNQHKDYRFSDYKFIRSNIEPDVEEEREYHYYSEDDNSQEEDDNNHDEDENQDEKVIEDFMERFTSYSIKNDNTSSNNQLKYFKNFIVKIEIGESINISGTLEETESVVGHEYYHRFKDNLPVENVPIRDISSFVNETNSSYYVSDQFSFFGNSIKSSTIFKYNTDE